MANAYRGDPGNLPRTVYTTPPAQDFALDSITFLLHCAGTATEHHAVIEYVDSSGVVVGSFMDWNIALDGATIRYTFGIGLIPSACDLTDGWTVEHDLPNTILDASTEIKIRSVDETGAAIAGDNVTAVIMYATQLASATSGDVVPTAREPIYFMPGHALV